MNIIVSIKADDLKKTAIIASQLVLVNKTSTPIDLITSSFGTHDKVIMHKDEMVPVSTRFNKLNMNFTCGDKVSKAVQLAEMLEFNLNKKKEEPTKGKKSKEDKNGEKKLQVQRKEYFYSPDDKTFMVRLIPTKIEGIRAIVINPSFRLMNLLPIDVQFHLKKDDYSNSSVLCKNNSMDIFEIDTGEGSILNLKI